MEGARGAGAGVPVAEADSTLAGLGLGEAVADVLEATGQGRVVEGEPDVIFHDPKPLARPVGRCVEDAEQVDFASRVNQLQGGDVARERDLRRGFGVGQGQLVEQPLNR